MFLLFDVDTLNLTCYTLTCISLQLTVKSELRKEFGLDALDMTDIVLVLEPIFRMKIPQWALTELFVTPMDIVDFICDTLGVL